MGQFPCGCPQEGRVNKLVFGSTIEDVATRLHGAKVFTKLDVRNGF